MKKIYLSAGFMAILVLFGGFVAQVHAQATTTPPVTISVTGPATLTIGQTGTWNVSAYDVWGGLSLMKVSWGDGTYSTSTLYGSSTAVRTFTHRYGTPGTKYILFSVYDTAGFSATTTRTVQITSTSTPISTSTLYTLTVQKFGTGGGTATGPGIYCGTDCTERYVASTTATLNASPNKFSRFAGWAGCDSATGTNCMVRMYANRNVAVGFNLINATTSPAMVSASLYEALQSELEGIKQRLLQILSQLN
ncbi:MAG: hypothetical protein AAB631_01215 [Patescibacteria group bacterium]